ncbi:RICIN domain-containing protein [Streptomyces sp. TP-A0356]|uniref:RICIN domain-containing protein n=1 Tax=Streptomyces sp. TP-A0356 TaxID=1359208 RepID=UPI0006E2FC2D|nr:RICIN domain-containing protein [Streptomyces sp. TP-A0356]
MARERNDDEVESEGGMHSAVSDTRLTELLRTDTPTAYPALRELRTRHRPAVHTYARLCTVDETAARQLTAQAFALAARDTARGSDPHGPWRHQLLLLTGRVTAAWATDERVTRLDAALLTQLRSAGSEGSTPPMLAAFQALPIRVQGLVWYGLVEQEPAERTAGLLGLSPQDVTYGIEPAFQALRQSLLRTRLAASGNPRCQDFRRLIEESVRPDTPRYSADLHAHMAHCGHCATAYEELSQLRDAPRAALAEGLLPWGGTAYVMGDADESAAAGTSRLPAWWPSRRLALAATAVGVALAPLLVYLLTSGGSGPARAASDVVTPKPQPVVTVTATVSLTPSPTPTPSPTTQSPSPTPTPPPSPTTRSPSPRPRPKPPAPHPPNGTYAQVVNVASGLCLDIRDGVIDKGTDVITAPCTSSDTQRWRVDTSRDVLQSSADPDYCLDSRGATYRGVGIWECSSVDGPNGQNLRFTVDSRGVIRPEIAPDHAVTAYGGDTVFLIPDQGADQQRWRAGAS